MKAYIGESESIHIEPETLAEALAIRYIVDRVDKQNADDMEAYKKGEDDGFIMSSPVVIHTRIPEKVEDKPNEYE